jgi:hypothetical protein
MPVPHGYDEKILREEKIEQQKQGQHHERAGYFALHQIL